MWVETPCGLVDTNVSKEHTASILGLKRLKMQAVCSSETLVCRGPTSTFYHHGNLNSHTVDSKVEMILKEAVESNLRYPVTGSCLEGLKKVTDPAPIMGTVSSCETSVNIYRLHVATSRITAIFILIAVRIREIPSCVRLLFCDILYSWVVKISSSLYQSGRKSNYLPSLSCVKVTLHSAITDDD
jgi:hypothetical protein